MTKRKEPPELLANKPPRLVPNDDAWVPVLRARVGDLGLTREEESYIAGHAGAACMNRAQAIAAGVAEAEKRLTKEYVAKAASAGRRGEEALLRKLITGGIKVGRLAKALRLDKAALKRRLG